MFMFSRQEQVILQVLTQDHLGPNATVRWPAKARDLCLWVAIFFQDFKKGGKGKREERAQYQTDLIKTQLVRERLLVATEWLLQT